MKDPVVVMAAVSLLLLVLWTVFIISWAWVW